MSEEQATSPKRSQSSHLIKLLVLAIVLVASIGFAGFFFVKYRQATASNPVHEQKQLVKRIGQAVQLPAEEPVILTISDKSKLSNQVLAARVENGDKLLVFNNAKRLVIYRPVQQKVTDMLSTENLPQDKQ